ncbi:MAG: hypothetical protein MPI95_04175 [Nitrosopumilus sp.]|nr:hypothetical protein [Nitrosopumilus sp.]MDA7958273.1 hypothetical protein [Nitrosopumilus sp.]
MYILDSSCIITIFEESDFPELMDLILKLDDIGVPELLIREELQSHGRQTISGERIEQYVNDNKVILLKNSQWDIIQFISELPYIKQTQFGPGEIYVMCAYKYNNTGFDVCCVIDEDKATKYSKEQGYAHVNTDYLLRRLLVEGHVNNRQFDKIRRNIRNNQSNQRRP